MESKEKQNKKKEELKTQNVRDRRNGKERENINENMLMGWNNWKSLSYSQY